MHCFLHFCLHNKACYFYSTLTKPYKYLAKEQLVCFQCNPPMLSLKASMFSLKIASGSCVGRGAMFALINVVCSQNIPHYGDLALVGGGGYCSASPHLPYSFLHFHTTASKEQTTVVPRSITAFIRHETAVTA